MNYRPRNSDQRTWHDRSATMVGYRNIEHSITASQGTQPQEQPVSTDEHASPEMSCPHENVDGWKILEEAQTDISQEEKRGNSDNKE